MANGDFKYRPKTISLVTVCAMVLVFHLLSPLPLSIMMLLLTSDRPVFVDKHGPPLTGIQEIIRIRPITKNGLNISQRCRIIFKTWVTWIYFLHSTRPPFFNPITLDHPGIESKLGGWFLWKYRIKGIAYYSTNNWTQNPWTDPMANNHNGDQFLFYPPSENNEIISYGSNNHRLVPSIRLELLRDSFEDYEYLYQLNGNAYPQVNVTTAADSQVNKIVNGLASYTRNSSFIYNLRKLIGQKIAGEISVIPDIQVPATHPRSEGQPGNFYINFQDPAGEPATTYTQDTYDNSYIYR